MKKILCMLLVGLSLCARAQIRDTLIISQSDVTIELDGQGYHHIKYGSSYVMEVGAPELPIVTKQYYIPHGATDVLLTSSVLSEQQVEGEFNIYPSQGLIPSNETNKNFIALDSIWLDSSYPIVSAEISAESGLLGYRIVTISIYPIVYDVKNKQLFLRNVQITLDYTESMEEPEETDTLRSSLRKNFCYDYVYRLVDNPEMMELYEITMKRVSIFARHVPISMFQNGFPYPDFIIITNEELKSAFTPLAEWKTRRGVYTIIETVEYINSTYLGLDLCEKIRNYIIEKEEDWGEGLAILLGGGINIVPSRIYNGTYGTEVTDIYYVDRNIRYPNQNNEFDHIAINSIIGRFPVDCISEAQIMVEKTIDYEKAAHNIDYGYIDNNLLADGYINVSNGSCWNGAMRSWYQYASEYEKRHWFQYDFFNQTGTVTYNEIEYVLSNTQTGIPYGEDLTRENFISALTEGREEFGYFHFVAHLDHSSPLSLGTSNLIRGEDFCYTHVKDMSYTPYYYQVMFSMGCSPANFATNCIAKELLMKLRGGVVAFLGNTDVGYAYEKTMLSRFYEIVYKESSLWDWDSFIGLAWLNALYDSHGQFCKLHLLGDPTLAFWTDIPIEQANQITTSNDTVILSRTNAMYGKGATICVHKKNEIYMVDTICYRKSISFSMANVLTSGYVYITSTGLGQKPQIDSVYIDRGENNLIEITSVEVTDDDFANDGVLSAGECGIIRVNYQSLSNETIDPSKLFISCSSSYIDIFSCVGNVTGPNQLTFLFQVKGNTPDLNEHNCKSPLFNINYIMGDKVQCIDCFHINVVGLKGDVRNVSYDLLTDTNEYEYKINVDYYLSSHSLVSQSSVKLKNPEASNVQMIDSIVYLSSELLDGNVFKFSFTVRLDDRASMYRNVSFDVELTDISGNSITHTIYPFTSIASAVSINEVNVTSGGTCIDLSWPKEINSRYYIYTSNTGSSYTLLNDTPIEGNYFRHDNLKPQTTYYYIIRKDSNNVSGVFSDVITATTTCGLMGEFPKIVSNMGAFKGLLNAWDVDLDGQKEIFAGCWDYFDNLGSIIAVKPLSGDLYNESNIEIIESFAVACNNFQNGLAIGELYDDGELYIIGCTYSDILGIKNGVYCYSCKDRNNDDEPDIEWQYESELMNSPRSPIIADLDGDDVSEIIVPSRTNVVIFNANGTIRKIIECNLEYRHIAVANILHGINEKQIIIPVDNVLSVYDKNGNILSDLCVTFTKKTSSPVICDYLCHEANDIIVADIISQDSVHVYLIDFTSGIPIKEKLFSNTFKDKGRNDAAIVVCDLNNDDALEIVSMGKNQLVVYDYDNPYNIITKKLRSRDWYDGTPIIADVDGDNYADVIYQSYDNNKGHIKAIDRYGNDIRSVDQYMYNTANDGLMAADVDGDGLIEIVAGTEASRFYVWKTKGNADHIEWGSARGNAQNTGEYGLVNYPQLVRTTTAISSDYDFEHDIYIVGGQLNITGSLTFPSHRKIVVWENGILNINGATLNNARIVVKPGGKVNITNGATINLRDTKSLVVPKGARLNISQGVIK